MPGSLALGKAIDAAACLCGQRDERLQASDKSDEARLAERLGKRLAAYHTIIGKERLDERKSLEDETGDCVLEVLQLIHEALLGKGEAQASDSLSTLIPLLGARDLQTVQTTLSILSNWKITPLISAFDGSLFVLQSATLSDQTPAKLQEVPDEETLQGRRQTEVLRFSSIIGDMGTCLDQIKSITGLEGRRSEVSNALLHSCAPHIVALAIRLAWGPIARKGDLQGDAIKQHSSSFLNALLRSISTNSCLRVLSATGQVTLATSKERRQRPSIPSFVKSTTERLYSAQLLRKDAVMALLKNTFGNDEDPGTSLTKKLVGIGHLLSTPPTNMPVDAFASVITPRLLEVISELPSEESLQQQAPSRQASATQKTAACYSLARMHEVAPETVSKTLHTHVWRYLSPTSKSETQDTSTSNFGRFHASVDLLFQIVEHSEPSTVFLSFLIAPVVIPLFTLHSFLKNNKLPTIAEVKGKERDPNDALASTTWSLLTTWTRLIEIEEACTVLGPSRRDGLFAISGTSVRAINSTAEDQFHPFWELKSGEICIEWRAAPSQQDLTSTFSSLNIDDLNPLVQTGADSEVIPPSFLSAFNFSPSPTILSSLLKASARKDISSEILSSLLEVYTMAKQSEKSLSSGTDTSTKSILYVQHILELINVFGSEALSGQANKVLTFINFALGSTDLPDHKEAELLAEDDNPVLTPSGKKEGAFAGLTNIGKQVEEDRIDVNADDEEEDEELVETALNLLLSLLEGDPNISMESHSILRVISAKLDVKASNGQNGEIRSLAKEARLVLTARQSLKVFSKADDTSKTRNTSNSLLEQAYARGNQSYQEALRLLQDPILPVRAHGLVMLKELAACGSTDTTKPRLMNPALTTAIVDIYIQAIKDDESFLYLNAVKGMAEMANSGGKSMIKRLVSLYLGQTNSFSSREEVDLQLRMGEALLQVVQKLEAALSPHVDQIVEPLLTAIRDPQRPTTLKSSYLSILGTCVEACPLAFSTSALGDQIVDAMLDLLSIETKRSFTLQQANEMEDPTQINSKLPQLRRAAVLLLTLFIRGSRHQLDAALEKKEESASRQEGLTALRLPNGSIVGGGVSSSQANVGGIANPLLLFSQNKAKRTSIVLGYVADTDSDSLVRHQSKELLDELHLLTLALYRG